MKIKKPMPVQAPPAASPAAPGGATIADRFKLENVAPAPARTVNKTATIIALVAAAIALGVSGILTFNLYQSLEFLKAA